MSNLRKPHVVGWQNLTAMLLTPTEVADMGPIMEIERNLRINLI
jgi:hypothetical protein